MHSACLAAILADATLGSGWRVSRSVGIVAARPITKKRSKRAALKLKCAICPILVWNNNSEVLEYINTGNEHLRA